MSDNTIQSKKPFKWTKELIKLAINNGWTQTEIAKACRTQQSVVSAWSKGDKQGNEQQLKPLLDIFGNKLRRNTFRLYWSIDSDSLSKVFHKVEGRVIFSQALYDMRRQGYKLKKKIPEMRFVIHYQGNNSFRIIKQKRFKFTSTNEELENIVDDAIWGSKISEIYTAQEVLEEMDKIMEDAEIRSKYPSDAATFPFLVRKALLENGYQIEGIKEYPVSW